MSITERCILVDTNVITDLNNAGVLNIFIKLDNVYMSDMVKHDEINSKTCNTNLIKDIKTVSSSFDEVIEMNLLSMNLPKLSMQDILNFVVARNNDFILATGDKRLKEYSEKNGVIVIRTLKIIELMYINKYISYNDVINAINRLKDNPNTRIPIKSLNDFLEKIKEFNF